ncbi:MAG: hypothetical protein J6Z14_09655 [Prevotella sp.]|nr:hypothetical protein [Prevotella sp.]
MKRIILLSLAALLAVSVSAQSPEELAAQQASLDSIFQAMLNAKPSKEAKAEAKRLEKEGWKPQEGEKSILQQIHESQVLAQEQMATADNTLTGRFLMQTAIQTSSAYTTAYATARAKAQALLGGMIETKVKSQMEARMKNQELAGGNAASESEFKQRIQTLVKQSLRNCIPVLCIYRQLPNNLYEVQLRLAVDGKVLQLYNQ